MPVVSSKQWGFMQAAKAGKLKGLGGPSEAVAKEFIDKTPSSARSKFASALMKRRKKVA